MKEEQIALIREYVSNVFFDQEKLIRYLDMHTSVGNEIFAYVDKKKCVRSNRREGYSSWLDDEDGYEPLDVESFIRRIPFYFYVWDGSLEKHRGDLGHILYATYDERESGGLTLEEVYQKLEYLFYVQKISLYDIFNYMIDQTGMVTQDYFLEWVDYLHLCEHLDGREKMPECFVASYNQVLEESKRKPIQYRISDFGNGDLYLRDGNIMTFEGVFPLDENGNPIIKWSGLRIINGSRIWNYSCEKSKVGQIGVELTPNIIIYYWTENAEGKEVWMQLYAGPQNMEFDYTILKTQREFYGMTQQEVADAVGVNVRTYQKWEYGETQPDGYYLLRLMNWLDIPSIQYAIRYSFPDE